MMSNMLMETNLVDQFASTFKMVHIDSHMITSDPYPGYSSSSKGKGSIYYLMSIEKTAKGREETFNLECYSSHTRTTDWLEAKETACYMTLTRGRQ